MAVVRLNISSSEEVRDWYKAQAEMYGMSMSALMSFVLTQYKQNEEGREMLKILSQASKEVGTEEVANDLRELLAEIKMLSK